MEDVIRSIPVPDRIPNALHLRMVYRSLLNRGRAYAAFVEDEGALIESVKGRGPVLDPFSGFGLIHQYGAAAQTDTVGVELNLPQFLWQRVTRPCGGSSIVQAVSTMQRDAASLPEIDAVPCAADKYFTDDGLEGLEKLYLWILNRVPSGGPEAEASATALSILLPFVGRFSAFSETSVAARTRQGGMILLRGWADDFRLYLRALAARVVISNRFGNNTHHITTLGDSQIFDFRTVEFGGVLTSPPYPNTQDYYTMFEPENQFLTWLVQRQATGLPSHNRALIGQTRLKGAPLQPASTNLTIVDQFFADVDRLPLTDRQRYDERIYYRRYHQLYFGGVTKALTNVWMSATEGMPGFIFVVNNTHRGVKVPVAESIAEALRRTGAGAVVRSLGEQFHVGTMNPRARGMRAKHERFVIEVNQ